MTIRKHCLGIGVVLFAAQSAWAEETNPGLGSYGQTPLQQDTGDAVQATCAGFVQSGTQPGTVPLFDTCRAMVHTGNDLSGTGPSRDSLGLDANELAASLQQIATEEFAATESMANEISSNRLNTLLSRLAELRSGARGFSVTGLTPGDDTVLAASDRWPGASGGGAGGDAFGSPLSGFLNLSYGTGDRDGSDRTDAFDFDSYNITAGADYRFSGELLSGKTFGSSIAGNRCDQFQAESHINAFGKSHASRIPEHGAPVVGDSAIVTAERLCTGADTGNIHTGGKHRGSSKKSR